MILEVLLRMLSLIVSHGVGVLFTDFPASFFMIGCIVCLGISLTVGINDTEVLLPLHYSAFFFANFE